MLIKAIFDLAKLDLSEFNDQTFDMWRKNDQDEFIDFLKGLEEIDQGMLDWMCDENMYEDIFGFYLMFSQAMLLVNQLQLTPEELQKADYLRKFEKSYFALESTVNQIEKWMKEAGLLHHIH